MPSAPYAKLLVSIEGGAAQSGGITCNSGESAQLSYESTVGWPSTPAPYVDVYSYPDGWEPDPADGWVEVDTTIEVSGTSVTATVWRYYGATPPPAFAAPTAPTWGKVLFRLVVGGGKKNGVRSADMTDYATAIQTLSPNLELEDIAYLEAGQFSGTKKSVAAQQANLRALDDNAGGGGGGTVTSVDQGQGVEVDANDPAAPIVSAPRLDDVTNPVATTGAVRLASGEAVMGRNAAGNADATVIELTSGDTVQLGDDTVANGAVVRSKSGGLFKWFVNNLEVLRFTASSLLFGNALSGTIGQVAQSGDSVTADLTLSPQAPYASASGANREPGDLIIDFPAPTNGGTARGTFRVRFAGSDTFTFSKPETYYSEFRNYLSGLLIRSNDLSGGTCELWFPGVTISANTIGFRDVGQATRMSLALGSTVEWRMGEAATVWRRTWVRDGDGNAMLYVDEATRAFASNATVGYQTAISYTIPDNCTALIEVRATCQDTTTGTASSFWKERTVSRFSAGSVTAVGSETNVRADKQGDVAHLMRVSIDTSTVYVEVDSGTSAAKWGIHITAQITKTTA